MSKALSDEIRRLSVLVDEFQAPFHSDPLVLGVYKKELHSHVEACLGSNLRARLSSALALNMESSQTEMAQRVISMLPADRSQAGTAIIQVLFFLVLTYKRLFKILPDSSRLFQGYTYEKSIVINHVGTAATTIRGVVPAELRQPLRWFRRRYQFPLLIWCGWPDATDGQQNQHRSLDCKDTLPSGSSLKFQEALQLLLIITQYPLLLLKYTLLNQ